MADSPGCMRCRMDLIRFVREVRLPRFTMRTGDTWNLPQVRHNADGSIQIGCGEAPAGSFVIEARDHARACHNGLPCPGDAHTIDACSSCGATIEPDADGPCCEGATIERVTVLRPLVALGVSQPPVFGTRADLERLGLVGEGEAA